MDDSSGRPSDAVPVAAGEVTITYRPERDGDPDPGEVVWAWVPYEDDPARGKDRPVAVIGVAGEDLVVVPLSSRDHDGRRDAEEWIEVGRGPWDGRGRVSFANVDRLLRVVPTAIRREGAALDRERFDRVVAGARARHPDLG
ncbi:type II toxin-antitoxin system PemK/MazF family toxin [Iamia sp. SCSIO 61187]|uniref:type II toxin-antitoxin system PemK/MazF family toxin n=1 Tax=Iamia sp. SCSIO 61187 TaxID=2722752 RepID=UPI001C63A8AF|nr:type II toxin-antitoxin system PemK/MazF family toxin [Iamia sp. SCSIO 61187]QYG94753.1 type II toxin-antitoxin system PemK/MazF family toxin [Iamia sp. SCSIO 61187]